MNVTPPLRKMLPGFADSFFVLYLPRMIVLVNKGKTTPEDHQAPRPTPNLP